LRVLNFSFRFTLDAECFHHLISDFGFQIWCDDYTTEKKKVEGSRLQPPIPPLRFNIVCAGDHEIIVPGKLGELVNENGCSYQQTSDAHTVTPAL
jgi:hypothetical protein